MSKPLRELVAGCGAKKMGGFGPLLFILLWRLLGQHGIQIFQ